MTALQEKKMKTKLELLLHGMCLSEFSYNVFQKDGTFFPEVIRSGASFGLECIVDDDIYVNVPIRNASKNRIADDCSQLIMSSGEELKLETIKDPFSYTLSIEDNKQIKRVAKTCYDRLDITLVTGCHYKHIGIGCEFCGIEKSIHYGNYVLSNDQVLRIMELAQKEKGKRIKHVLLSGGSMISEDMGIHLFTERADRIKEHYPTLSIYVMLPPPTNLSVLQRLLDSGIDEVAMNMELLSDEALGLIPAKKLIGKERYLKSLEFLASRMPQYSVRSILMVGLEDDKYTLEGVTDLSKRGVMPILSLYRAINNHKLKLLDSVSVDSLFELWMNAMEICTRNGTLLGPLCIPCQNNTISFPTNSQYRFY